MPNFFPEGNSPLPTDSEERSLLKAVSLLQSIAAGGGSGGGNGSTNYELKSANFTAEIGKNYAVDTTAGVVSVTLPSDSQTGDVVGFADARGTWASNPITILRNGKFIEGSTINFSNNAAGTFFVVLFIDNSTGWRVLTSGTKPLNLTLPTVGGTYDFTSTNGTWTGSPTSFTYQWQMSDNGTSGWTNIDGATSSTYLAAEADEGKFVRIGVVATNSNGPSVVTYSAASNPIDLPDFPTAGLLAFWKLDDVNDSSGNGNTLTNTNAVQFVAGKIGNCAEFDGSNRLNRGSLSASIAQDADRTFSIWCYRNSTSNNDNLFGSGSTFNIWFNASDLKVDNGQAPDFVVENASTYVPSQTWCHVVMLMESNIIKIYIDNVLRKEGAKSVTYPILSNLGVGNFNNNEIAFRGKLDAAGVWNRALTEQEIAQLFNNGIGVEPA